MTGHKFDGPKYSTSTVAQELPLELQIFLWQLVEERAQTGQADYLQVFELSNGTLDDGNTALIITHTQEQPPMKQTYSLTTVAPRNCKLYVIDDLSFSTMLFASER